MKALSADKKDDIQALINKRVAAVMQITVNVTVILSNAGTAVLVHTYTYAHS